jgi:hypothetical protein
MGLIQQVIQASNQVADAVVDAGTAAADQVATAGEEAADAVAAAGQEAADAVAKAGEDAKDSAVADAARRAAHEVATAARHAAQNIANAGRRATEAITREARDATRRIQRQIEASALSVGGFSAPSKPKKNRQLTDDEIQLAKVVYGDSSLPYHKIWISPRLGLGGSYYTIPGTHKGTYVLHLGPDPYEDATDPTRGQGDDPLGQPGTGDAFFIHELAHVWQGCHWKHHNDYIVDSVIHQTSQGDDAYAYELGEKWSHYHAEQQAQIIQDWYRNKFRSVSEDADNARRLDYINTNVRTGDNDA